MPRHSAWGSGDVSPDGVAGAEPMRKDVSPDGVQGRSPCEAAMLIKSPPASNLL